MQNSIAIFVLGLICVLIGFLNVKGYITALGSNHVKHLSDGDKSAYGKTVGLGTIICGGVLVVYSALSALSKFTGFGFFTSIGKWIVVAGIIIGLLMAIYATLKYKEGLFKSKK